MSGFIAPVAENYDQICNRIFHFFHFSAIKILEVNFVCIFSKSEITFFSAITFFNFLATVNLLCRKWPMRSLTQICDRSFHKMRSHFLFFFSSSQFFSVLNIAKESPWIVKLSLKTSMIFSTYSEKKILTIYLWKVAGVL